MAAVRRELSTELKEVIVSLYLSGLKHSDIARRLEIPRPTISSIIDRYRKRGSVENNRRKGKHAKLSDRDSRKLLRLVKENSKRKLSDITALFNENRDSIVSKRTVQRSLYKQGYFRRVVRKRIRIREANIKARLSWCRGNRFKTVDNYWNRVIFSDECKVDVGSDNRIFVWRKVGEEWMPCCLSTPPTPKFSLMIWGCITFDGVGTVTVLDGNINAQKYINIIDEQLWPVIARHFPRNNYIFQDDNAPIHRARIVQEFKVQNNMHSMVWPAQSPDLNIIENIWLRLKRELKNGNETFMCINQLEAAIRRIWVNIPTDYVQNLYRSIPRRIHRVLRSKGYITKY